MIQMPNLDPAFSSLEENERFGAGQYGAATAVILSSLQQKWESQSIKTSVTYTNLPFTFVFQFLE